MSSTSSTTACRGISAPADASCSRRFDRPALKPLPAEPLRLCRMEGVPRRPRLSRRGREALLLGAAQAAAREGLGAHHGAHGRGLPRGKRVAAHVRSSSNRSTRRCASTCRARHRRYADWTPERLQAPGRRDRPQHIGAGRDHPARTPHPEQGFRSCIGILRLAKTHGRDRLEAACGRALEIGARSYTSVNSILKNNLDRQRPEPATDGPAIMHPNIRGPGYFH